MALAFDPGESGFSRGNALYLAHAADVAYLREPEREGRARLGLRVHPFRHRVTRARGFVGVCDTHAVLAFRGTNPGTLQNWVTDTVVRLVESEHYAGRVHHGFASVLRRSWGQVEGILEEAGERPLFLTGHSMGGALAVLTACRLAAAGKQAVATYTYGSPRVGDAMFCSGYDLPTYRVVNRLDLVPEIPLASVKRVLPMRPRLTNEKILEKLHRLADRMPSYAHVNTLVYIDREGGISEGKEVVAWGEQAVRRALQTRGKSFMEGIRDHLLSNYIRALDERG